MWNGPATEITLSIDKSAEKPDGCAVIANQAEHGPIIAAAAFNYNKAW